MCLSSHTTLNFVQNALFQPGNLCLADANFTGNLHLGLSVIKPQGEDPLFPWGQLLHRLLHGLQQRKAVLQA